MTEQRISQLLMSVFSDDIHCLNGHSNETLLLLLFIRHKHPLLVLTTTTVPAQHGKPVTRTSEVIHTHQKHLFFTLEQGFLPVAKIKLGMHVLRADGTYGVVTGWRLVPVTKVMYNLEVEQDHTFTVRDGQWVGHNCEGNPPGGWKKSKSFLSKLTLLVN